MFPDLPHLADIEEDEQCVHKDVVEASAKVVTLQVSLPSELMFFCPYSPRYMGMGPSLDPPVPTVGGGR